MEPLRQARRADSRQDTGHFELGRDAGRPGQGGPRIRCPKCQWEPERDSLWRCACLYLWNTFETEGCCPSCAKRWETTQCLRCKAWSPHRAWYAEEDLSR